MRVRTIVLAAVVASARRPRRHRPRLGPSRRREDEGRRRVDDPARRLRRRGRQRPRVQGTEACRRQRRRAGSATIQTFQGETFEFAIDVTCLEFYDGNRAKLGGVITW